jgi:hypothetical protein
MREIKFRLLKDGKIVGYEIHSLPVVRKKVDIFHSEDGEEWNNVAYHKHAFIDHDDKEQFIMRKDKNGIREENKMKTQILSRAAVFTGIIVLASAAYFIWG